MPIKISLLYLTIFVGFFMHSCTESATINQAINVKTTNNYLTTINELNKDFFNNYWEMEQLILAQLDKEGTNYFIENDCFKILAHYESTLKQYVEICKQINYNNTGGLLNQFARTCSPCAYIVMTYSP